MGQERGVIYARTSGVQQKEKQAIHAQLSLGKAILALRGIMLVGTYIDDGISGETIEQRLQMLRLLDDAEQGKFHYLFVADIDRLTRSQKSVDWEIIKESLRRGKVFLLTPSQEYDFGNEDQEFVSDLFAKIAAYEKKKIVRRMVWGKQEKARQGLFYGGRIPLGYKLNPQTRQLEIEEAEAETVRLIFRLSREGWGYRRIAKHLNSLGVSAPSRLRGYRGKLGEWTWGTIGMLVQNPVYQGETRASEPGVSKCPC